MHSLLLSLKEQKALYEKALAYAKQQLNPKVKGSVRCESHNGHFQYFLFPEKYEKDFRGQYLRKNQREIASTIAQQDYYKKLIPELELMIKRIDDFMRGCQPEQLEKIYSDMCDARRALINPLFESTELAVKKWQEEAYEKKPFSIDNRTEFITDRGERVRSKSEKIIADRLNGRNIPYKYECPLEVYDWSRLVTIHPDFTIFKRSTRSIVMHEHLGMMDHAAYVEDAMHRIRVLEKNGYLLGQKLFMTYETQSEPLTTSLIDSYIDAYYL